MKTTTTPSLLVLCLALAGMALHAQSTAPTSSLVSLIAEARGLPLLQPDQVPIRGGTYWVIEPWGINGVTAVPWPCPPFDPTLPIYAIASESRVFLVDGTVGTQPVLIPSLSRRLGASYTLETVVEAEANLVVNLITQVQTEQANLNQNGYPAFGTNGFGEGGLPISSYVYKIDTNILWLQITNISDGTVYANMYQATDYVYAVWSTTDLSIPFPLWQVETEVFPTNTNCMPFTVSQSGRQDLFLRAEDWTGVSANGNVTELWWLYYYFGNAGLSLCDTNLDVWGSNTLVFDYTNGIAPTDYYSGFLPELQPMSGDQQSGPLGAFLPQPLVVQVTDGYGFGISLSNAPLTFSVSSGLSQLAATNGGTLVTNLNVATDGNGLAEAWLFLPTNAPVVNSVTVTAQTGPYSEQLLLFTAYEGEVAPPDISPAGGAFTGIQSVAVSCSTTGAIMHYTLDGNDPTEDDPAATNGQSLLVPWTATLNVAAFDDAVLLPSEVQSADFAIIHPLVAGRKHTMILNPDEMVLAAGSNGSGQLGDGTTIDRTNLVGVLNLTAAVGVAAGALHSLAWAADGSAWAWGDDSYGQLGDGNSSGQQSTPVQVTNLTGIVQMAGGNQHSLALDSNQVVWAWGNNTSGQLGDGTMTPQPVPEALSALSNIVQIAAGGAHSLALAGDESVQAWGNNDYGQLGDGSATQRTTPVIVNGLTNALEIAAGLNHSLAVVADETVRAWGNNDYGQLGNGTFTESNQPVKVLGLSNIVAIAAGEYHNLALKSDGTVWSWGYNSHGQLGDGTTSNRTTPVPVSGLSNVLAITAGWAHSAALKSDGTVMVWGSIPYGLNGDASISFSTVPVTEEPSIPVNWEPPTITVQPFSQEVLVGDDVTFSVVATGTNLTYQWNLEGSPIPGATASVYTINNVQSGGNYTVTVGTGLDSVVSTNAVLTVDGGTGWPNLMQVLGQRLNYTFKNGVTYYIGSPVQLFGTTMIEGGAVLKFDSDLYTNSSLIVMGPLNCKTETYYPAFLTSVDDPCVGEYIGYGYYPEPYITGTPYLNLSQITNASISNLRISYADEGVSTPASGQLDVWDCQFLQCNTGIVNEFGGVDCLHNVLLSGCGDVVCACTNNCTIIAEQMTADVSQFLNSTIYSACVCLTNSIIMGNAGSVSSPTLKVNPSATNFQAVGAGNYYLAANSSLHQSGTANISRRLLTELKNRTTYPPAVIPSFMQLNGNLMLGPQAQRYTNGAPDLGYYYPALDYTVADFINFGNITVLPGTAIGFREEYWSSWGWTFLGFDMREGSSLVSHGTANQPNIFVDSSLIQEQFQFYTVVSFVPDYESLDPSIAAPVMDLRFCNLFASPEFYHSWSGYDEFFGSETSPDSLVTWTMRDCKLHGGRVNLGAPDDGTFYGMPMDYVYGSGAVAWINNSFESVNINYDPTYYAAIQIINCDMQLQASNNLFKNAGWFVLEPFPASAGNSIFENDLFDKVDFLQDTNQPLDFDYNGYWPMQASELFWSQDPWLLSPTASGDAGQLMPAIGGNQSGTHEQVLSSAPPYQPGPFGKFYIQTNTPLYGAASDSAANLGLFHYTTRVDEVKEGTDVTASKPNASIGLHYIAATNGVPMDFDGDGIPDYVENWHGDGNYSQWVGVETDWKNAITDGYTPDASNSIYLDIDLSGNGLIGSVKAALGIVPLDSSNPLSIPMSSTQGAYSGAITIPLSLSPSLDASSSLQLFLDDGEANANVYNTGSGWFADLDTSQIPNGGHAIYLEYSVDSDADPAACGVAGPAHFVTISNALTLSDLSVWYTDLVTIDAAVNTTATSYTIDFYDQSTDEYLDSVSGSVSGGTLHATWSAASLANGSLTCNISLSNGSVNNPPTTVTITIKHRQGIAHKSFTIAYGNNNFPANALTELGNQILGGLGAGDIPGLVDTLATDYSDLYGDDTQGQAYNLLPSGPGGNVFHASSFRWDGSPSTTPILTAALTNSDSGNFFFWGHGNPAKIGVSDTTDKILASDVETGLGNAGTNVLNPYRLVFLQGCHTYSRKWADAFGIIFQDMGSVYSAEYMQNELHLDPQSFVGWDYYLPFPRSDVGDMDELAQCFSDFAEDWQSGMTITECMQDYANEYYSCGPDLNVFYDWFLLKYDFNRAIYHYKISGCYDLTTTYR